MTYVLRTRNTYGTLPLSANDLLLQEGLRQ